MLRHCGDARYVYNLAVEQFFDRAPRPGDRAPRHLQRSKHLTEARAEFDWLRSGSVMVQQQALRDFDQALRNWWNGTHRAPTFHKEGMHESFRVVGRQALRIEQLNRKWSRVLIPKGGWVKLRRTRDLRPWKSFRIKRDRAGRWWICFTGIPDPIPAPGNGEVVGIDRGVHVTMALSTGELLDIPKVTKRQKQRRVRLEREMARRQKKSKRRKSTRRKLGRLHARGAQQRKDFVEKATTDIARRFDLIRIENLQVNALMKSARGTVENPGKNVAQKRGTSRGISESNWGMIDRRLHDKARDRVEKIPAPYTSQECHECGHTDQGNRENQAFLCLRCGHTAHADVNAALNIAARHAVAGRGDIPKAGDTVPVLAGALSTKRQPQLIPSG